MATQQSLFRALQDGKRDAQRRAEYTMPYRIVPLKKDGTPYAKPTAYARTIQEAQATAERLRDLNPGRTYVVCFH